MIYAILDHLDAPRGVDALSRLLGVAPPVVEDALRLLESRGYLTKVEEGAPGCPSCGACSMKRLCPSKASGQPVWQLSAKGAQRRRGEPARLVELAVR